MSKSISITAYEIFTVLAHLKGDGIQKVNFYELNRAVNRQRAMEGRKKKLSPQTMHYHLSNLVQLPFLSKEVRELNTSYFLVNGLYKLTENHPPLCMNIDDKIVHVVMSCEHIRTCQETTLSRGCLEKLSQ